MLRVIHKISPILFVCTVGLLTARVNAGSKPWTWTYFKDGKCLTADQDLHRNLVQILTYASRGQEGCKYITPELGFDFRGVECKTERGSQLLALSTSQENCKRDRRVLALLQERWFAYVPSKQACVDPLQVAEGANMSPWAVIQQAPKCKENHIAEGVLQLDCRKARDLIGADFLQYASTAEGCNYIREAVNGNPQRAPE